MAKHASPATVKASLLACGAFVVLSFFTGAFSDLAARVNGVLAGRLHQVDRTPAVVFSVEDDVSKTGGPSNRWVAPGSSELQTFSGDCRGFDTWAKGKPGAQPVDPLIGVTLTGASDVHVVVQRVRAKIVSTSAPAAGRLLLSCGEGGPLNVVTATVSLQNPDAPTQYVDASGRPLRHLAYSLARDEAAFFVVEHAEDPLPADMTWDLLVDYTVGEKTFTANLNEMHLDGRHFDSPSPCGRRNLTWQPGWVAVQARC